MASGALFLNHLYSTPSQGFRTRHIMTAGKQEHNHFTNLHASVQSLAQIEHSLLPKTIWNYSIAVDFISLPLGQTCWNLKSLKVAAPCEWLGFNNDVWGDSFINYLWITNSFNLKSKRFGSSWCSCMVSSSSFFRCIWSYIGLGIYFIN